MKRALIAASGLTLLMAGTALAVGGGGHGADLNFPPSLASYDDADFEGISQTLSHRVDTAPFNLVATLIFLCAIIHTFLTSKFLEISHSWAHQHAERIVRGEKPKESVHFGAGIFHFLGEVEAVFGIWAIALVGAITAFYDWSTAVFYVTHKVNYTEPMFVGVIMTLAATRPILKAAELMMWKIANLFGGMLVAWWLTILTFGPILGSFITEPAAMTISALLLGEKFYELGPSSKFKYATLGLLFVNISVGGTLTHFAAPPVLMVVGSWGWDLMHMMTNFGWKAVIGICIANGLYFYLFRSELDRLQSKYALVRMKRELQSQYVKRAELEAEFDNLENIVEDELGFHSSLEAKCAEIKARLKDRIIGSLEGTSVNVELLEEAFEKQHNESVFSVSLTGVLGYEYL